MSHGAGHGAMEGGVSLALVCKVFQALQGVLDAALDILDGQVGGRGARQQRGHDNCRRSHAMRFRTLRARSAGLPGVRCCRVRGALCGMGRSGRAGYREWLHAV